MDPQSHEDRRREVEVAHPIVDENESYGPPSPRRFERLPCGCPIDSGCSGHHGAAQ